MSSNPSFCIWHTNFPWATRGISVAVVVVFCQLAVMLNLYCCCSLVFPCHWYEDRQRNVLTIMRCQFSAGQSLSHVRLFATPWTAAYLASLSITSPWRILKLMAIELDGDATQPSHPLSFPSPTAFNLSQHQGIFKWVSSLHQVAKVLGSQLQHQSFQWIFRFGFL